MLYVSETNQTIARDGIDARFVAGVPRPLRPYLVDVALEHGITPVGDEPKPAEDLDAAIKAAIEKLLEAGKKSDFSIDGLPKVRSIERILSRQITTEDRDRVWRGALNDNSGEQHTS